MAIATTERSYIRQNIDPHIIDEISRLKESLKAVILAHNYQLPEIQMVADFVGDSLELAMKASKLSGIEYIFFCGVHFMAETAAILNPDSKVIIPDMKAGCPLADMITVEDIKELKKEYKNAPIVAYINTSAAVKAEVDICCTSSNAVKVVNSLPEKKIIFVPDKNLGFFVKRQIREKEIVIWNGFCPTHLWFSEEDVEKARRKYPQAVIVVHPECREEVQLKSDFVLSTGGMFKLPREINAREFVIGTEVGMLFRLKQTYPDREFYPLNERALCPNMKKNTLEKLLNQMRKPENLVQVEKKIADSALKAIKRMLAVT
ncbi:MAG: quinolinate synthase NadA [Actinobacteria bacterium]|nr:quinolinate synthase NadA [Actinomycetota bacterium]